MTTTAKLVRPSLSFRFFWGEEAVGETLVLFIAPVEMAGTTPQDRKLRARQAYGFFYLRPEEESGALSAAKRPVRAKRSAYEEYLGTTVVDEMLGASSLEAFLENVHYHIERDGEGRIISLLRADDPPINPALDYRVLREVASHVLGAELVFANEFGDGWEWKADGDELCHREGHVTVESKGTD